MNLESINFRCVNKAGKLIGYYRVTHNTDIKVSHSQAKIDENFANYFLKTKSDNKGFAVLKVHVKGYRKALVSYSGKIKAQIVATL